MADQPTLLPEPLLPVPLLPAPLLPVYLDILRICLSTSSKQKTTNIKLGSPFIKASYYVVDRNDRGTNIPRGGQTSTNTLTTIIATADVDIHLPAKSLLYELSNVEGEIGDRLTWQRP